MTEKTTSILHRRKKGEAVKKEIFSVCLLIVMLTAALINIHCIKDLADEISKDVTESVNAASAGDWDTARKLAEHAETTWQSCAGYTHVVLRHSEIDTVSDALYDFMTHIYDHNAKSSATAAGKVKYHLNSIYQMEQVRFGSIF